MLKTFTAWITRIYAAHIRKRDQMLQEQHRADEIMTLINRENK